jgi:hypothetical protein
LSSVLSQTPISMRHTISPVRGHLSRPLYAFSSRPAFYPSLSANAC